MRARLSRWHAFSRFLDDRRLCTSNNAAERELRVNAVSRRNWTFARFMRFRRLDYSICALLRGMARKAAAFLTYQLAQRSAEHFLECSRGISLLCQ